MYSKPNMQKQHLFEYAIIRIVPRVEREEFVNAGVVLYCKGQKFLNCRYSINKEKINALCAGADCTELENYLTAFAQICRGEKNGGPIATLDLPGRFRWLTATRSTMVQTSKVHPGFCTDAAHTLEQLFAQFVL